MQPKTREEFKRRKEEEEGKKKEKIKKKTGKMIEGRAVNPFCCDSSEYCVKMIYALLSQFWVNDIAAPCSMMFIFFELFSFLLNIISYC